MKDKYGALDGLDVDRCSQNVGANLSMQLIHTHRKSFVGLSRQPLYLVANITARSASGGSS
jgi:hypothetical protein